MQIPRRMFLRGVGVSMALPWLESRPVWGDEPMGQTMPPHAPVRTAVLFAGNGFHSKEWWAKGTGKNMELGQVLAPLADFREHQHDNDFLVDFLDHLSAEGWMYYNKALDDFYHGQFTPR